MKKNKILLISANQYAIPYPVYPIGLSYISTFLQNRLPDYDIRIFDLILKNLDDLIEDIKDYKPDYFGISLRNIDDVNIYSKETFINSYKNIIDEIRKISKSIIIIGGSGFSIFPEELFGFLKPDFGIVGDGEESFYKLISALNNKSDYGSIDGLVYFNKNNIIINSRKYYSEDLNYCYEENLIDYYWKNSGMLNIQTKRGCPYNCIYCTYPLIEGNKVRLLNSDRIIEALSDIYFNKRIDYVFFTDSVFNINNDFNIELAEKIIKNKIGIKWGGYFSFRNLNEKLLILLKKAGLTHIEFGTESICNTTLKKYGKQFTVSDIIEKSKICNKLDIDFAHFMILGGYGETEDTLNETFENSKKINRTVFFPFIGMRIYPGTKLFEIAIKEKIIHKDDNLLEPTYYISDKINMSTIKEKALKTGKRWVFPDEDMTEVMNKMRLKNKKGPLWEYLIK